MEDLEDAKWTPSCHDQRNPMEGMHEMITSPSANVNDGIAEGLVQECKNSVVIRAGFVISKQVRQNYTIDPVTLHTHHPKLPPIPNTPPPTDSSHNLTHSLTHFNPSRPACATLISSSTLPPLTPIAPNILPCPSLIGRPPPNTTRPL